MSVCYDSHGIPIPCGTGWTVYDSYRTDPRYQRYFTIAWTSTLAVAFLFAASSISNYFRERGFLRTWGRWYGAFGVYDDSVTAGYTKIDESTKALEQQPVRRVSALRRGLLAVSALVRSVTRSNFKAPFSRRYLSLSTGQILLVLLVPIFLLATLFPESQLAENPNRFGFLALACIPPLFVLSSKNGAVSLLLGQSWVAVNFLHRWLGRAVLVLVVCHFGLWTVQWSRAGELGEFLSSSKERRGIGAFAFLLLITISSLPPFRRFSYPLFFTLHYVSILGFLVFLNQHTIYARGWATWSVVGIYAVDIAGRIASMRIRWVELEALEGGMTKIKMSGVNGGWVGGQTLDLRLFFVPPPSDREDRHDATAIKMLSKRSLESVYQALKAASRPFESHPFSIATAPPARTAASIRGGGGVDGRGIELYAKSCGRGTWTDDLHQFARCATSPTESYQPLSTSPSSTATASLKPKKVHVLSLFFGPYASALPTYATAEVYEDKETVSLFAAGSGMSFVMGVVEELIGRRLEQGKGGLVEIVWIVREQAHLNWFLPRLDSLLSSIPSSHPLSVSLHVHVTSSGPSSSESPPMRLPPRTTLNLSSRPNLRSIVDDQISRLVSPCSHCYPICPCGDANNDGVCANEEEECVGGCGGVGNGTELLFDTRGGGGGRLAQDSRAFEKDGSEASNGRPDDEIREASSSCCRSKSNERERDDEKADDKIRQVKACCSSRGRAGCCSPRYPPNTLSGSDDVQEVPTPLKVRNGGMAVFVCGPNRMTGEIRNAVASIPIAKQVRIGGIELYAEHYGI